MKVIWERLAPTKRYEIQELYKDKGKWVPFGSNQPRLYDRDFAIAKAEELARTNPGLSLRVVERVS